jgi:uncharacterized protein YndB with AHSA1/START domain
MDGRDAAILTIDGEWQIRFEPRAVGAVIRFHQAGLDLWSEGEITRLVPGRVIEWLWGGLFGPASPILWEITPEPGGCRLTLRHRIDDPSVLGRTLAGWHVCLERMRAVIEEDPDTSGRGRWPALFEGYKGDLLTAGVTTPQQGAPTPPPAKP